MKLFITHLTLLECHVYVLILCMLPWGMHSLSVTCPCLDILHFTMGDVLFEWDTSMCWFHVCYHEGCTVWVGHFHVLISCMLPWGMYCLSGTLPCVDFMYVTMGDVLFEWDTSMCWFHVCYHEGSTLHRQNMYNCQMTSISPTQIYLKVCVFPRQQLIKC